MNQKSLSKSPNPVFSQFFSRKQTTVILQGYPFRDFHASTCISIDYHISSYRPFFYRPVHLTRNCRLFLKILLQHSTLLYSSLISQLNTKLYLFCFIWYHQTIFFYFNIVKPIINYLNFNFNHICKRLSILFLFKKRTITFRTHMVDF